MFYIKFGIILSVIVIIFVLNHYFILPIKDEIIINDTESYSIPQDNNFFETQRHYECSGYSCAYVLRSLGTQVKGDDVYQKLQNKLPLGFILPKSIIMYCKKNNYEAKYYRGTLQTLKTRLQNGRPIIIFIKVFENKSFLHFTSVIGYNKNALLIAESLDFLQKSDLVIGNRELEYKQLRKLWNTNIPFHSYTYIVIEPKS